MSHSICTVIFSKDRGLQLDATIRSLLMNGNNIESAKNYVLYTASNNVHENQYKSLSKKHKSLKFIKEQDFKYDLIAIIKKYDYILFLVDDNIFTRKFDITHVVSTLKKSKNAIGFSLRLGQNTTYCYSLNTKQKIPNFTYIDSDTLEYSWTESEHDFSYPLEVSSSVFRTVDILHLLNNLNYSNPNTLEERLAASTHIFKNTHSRLVCFKKSVTFCAPINKVQSLFNNRSGNKSAYSADILAELYAIGMHINTHAYQNFTPNACHQEVPCIMNLNEYASKTSFKEIEDLLRIASRFIDQNKTSAAEAILNSIEASCFNNATIYTELAKLKYAIRDITGSLNLCEKALEKDKSNNTARILVAKIKKSINKENSKISLKPHFVSIIIPCYNQAKFLSDSIQSVINQTYQHWECIVVDDGSPDNTQEVAMQLIAKYPDKSIRLLTKNNGGLADARNFGVANSSGEYWLPLDADDMLHKNFLLRTVPVLKDNPHIGFVYTDIQHFGTRMDTWKLPPFDARTFIFTDNIGCVCSLTRRITWEEVGGYNPSMKEGYEDWDFWIGCIENNWSGHHINEPLFFYRKKNESFLKDANDKRAYLISKIVLNHPSFYPKNYLDIAKLTVLDFKTKSKNSTINFVEKNFSLSDYFNTYDFKINKKENTITQDKLYKETNKNSKRILIAFPYYLPSEGGVEHVIENLSDGLQSKGWDVTIACRPHPERHSNIINGANIAEFDIKGCSSRGFLGNTQSFLDFLRREQFDIVYTIGTSTWTSDLIGWNAESIPGKKIWVPTGYYNIFNPTFWNLYKSLPDFLHGFDAVIQLSNEYRDSTIHRLLSLTNMITIPNGIFPEQFKKRTTLFRNKYNIRKKIILNVSNHFFNKGHADIRNAFIEAKLDNYCLVIIGNKETFGNRECYDDCMSNNNKDIIHLTNVSRNEVIEAFIEADIYINASHYECFPISLLEAMASETPFVSTNVGSVKELRGGITTTRNNLSKCLQSLASDTHLYEHLKELCKEEIQNKYSFELVLKKHTDLFDAITNNRIEKSNPVISLNTLISIINENFQKGRAEESFWFASFALLHTKKPSKDYTTLYKFCLNTFPSQIISHVCNGKKLEYHKKISNNIKSIHNSSLAFSPYFVSIIDNKLTSKNFIKSIIDKTDVNTAMTSIQKIKENIIQFINNTNSMPILFIEIHYWTLCVLLYKINKISEAKILCQEFYKISTQNSFFQLFKTLLLTKQNITTPRRNSEISVIIPLYNQGKYLKQAIESVANQSIPCHEIIVINDGSTDKSLDIATKIAEKYQSIKIKVISQKNCGKGYTRNRGVKEASGKYICVLDADDMIATSYFESALFLFEKYKDLGWVTPQTLQFGLRHNNIHWSHESNFIKSLLECPAPVSAIYKKDMWVEVGGYCESMTDREDWDFWICAGELGWHGKTTDTVEFLYRKHDVRWGERHEINIASKKEIIMRHPWFYKNLSDPQLTSAASFHPTGVFPEDVLDKKAISLVPKHPASRLEFTAAMSTIKQLYAERKNGSNYKRRILFYFFKNVHIPILLPLYHALKTQNADVDIAFSYLPPSPEIRAGLLPDEVRIIAQTGVPIHATPQVFRPDLTFIADSVYPWVEGCGKLVHVGHGVLSKGQYYTDTPTARREELADMVCVPGKHHQGIMRRIISKPVVATGMCKLDDLFSGKINRASVIKQFGLHDDYRYVLFAPTFNDELSAIPFVKDRIGEVLPGDKTLLIVKLHPSTKPEYKEMYRALPSRDKRVIYADELDITPFLALCDVMISDVSSAMMEFAALDKPVILFNNPNWARYQNYNPADIEFQWRDIGTQVADLDEMKEAVSRYLEDPGLHADKRKKYTDLLFANKRDGNAAQRIVKLALSLLEVEQKR